VTAPGVLPPARELHALTSVSPSRATGLASCALREVWAANHAPGLLPTPPAAWLGTVAHRLLEEAGRGMLNGLTPSGIEGRWVELLIDSEKNAARSWLDRYLLPLRVAIPDFEVRKRQAIVRARALAAETSAAGPTHKTGAHSRLGFEVAIATPDGHAGGRIDAVIPTPCGPVLRDYKSGAIYERTSGQTKLIKSEFAVQLKVYAAIYARMTGIWPVGLEVLPLVGSAEDVAFTADECERLLEEMLQLRESINAVVDAELPLLTKMQRLANPSPSVCAYCLYRPHCVPYREASESDADGWPLDIHGQLVEMRTLGNGRMMLTVNVDGSVVRIRGLDASPERHPAIQEIVSGDAVAAFSLRANGSPSSFMEGRFTVIYRAKSEGEE